MQPNPNKPKLKVTPEGERKLSNVSLFSVIGFTVCLVAAWRAISFDRTECESSCNISSDTKFLITISLSFVLWYAFGSLFERFRRGKLRDLLETGAEEAKPEEVLVDERQERDIGHHAEAKSGMPKRALTEAAAASSTASSSKTHRLFSNMQGKAADKPIEPPTSVSDVQSQEHNFVG